MNSKDSSCNIILYAISNWRMTPTFGTYRNTFFIRKFQGTLTYCHSSQKWYMDNLSLFCLFYFPFVFSFCLSLASFPFCVCLFFFDTTWDICKLTFWLVFNANNTGTNTNALRMNYFRKETHDSLPGSETKIHRMERCDNL